jgi:hypothetical protein
LLRQIAVRIDENGGGPTLSFRRHQLLPQAAQQAGLALSWIASKKARFQSL